MQSSDTKEQQPTITAAKLAQERQFANLNKGRISDKQNSIKRARLSYPKLPAVLRMLFHGATSREIMDETGVTGQALKRLTDSLRTPAADKILYISGWDRHGAIWAPVWKIGDSKDKPKPPRLTQAQKSQRHRDKMKQIALSRALINPTPAQDHGTTATPDNKA